ncbi:MAG: glutamate 5-kinase [Bacillota bacterium]|nr:glutamate 5-kinase [Bacillota bacterium]
MSDLLSNCKRIVFKIGSSTLMKDNGQVDGATIHRLTALWSSLHEEGKEIILVSSGAIAMGWGDLGLKAKPKAIPEKQAAAAVGQSKLMALYDDFFSVCGIGVGQVLLPRDDIADRHRYLNARNTLNVLLKERIIPIINENDTVAFEEIKFGENDTLASLVGGLIDADLVLLLSDIDGLYTADPRKDTSATLIHQVTEINDKIRELAGGVGTTMGSGGMKSKVDAAKIAGQSGIPLIICQGKDVANIADILKGGQRCTIFLPHEQGLKHRDRWIAYGSAIEGSVTADSGAVRALLHGKSLLPVGVIACEGTFGRGSVIAVKDPTGKEIARGITNYHAADILDIMGKKSDAEEDIFEVIHCDNLVLKD